MEINKYAGCFLCENWIEHPQQLGLLHLGFPRCFILIPSKGDFYFSDYEAFKRESHIQWLDPSESYSDTEKEEVIRKLWNFSIAEEALERDTLGM